MHCTLLANHTSTMTTQRLCRRRLLAVAAIAVAMLPIAAALPQPIPQGGEQASISSTTTPSASSAGSTGSNSVPSMTPSSGSLPTAASAASSAASHPDSNLRTTTVTEVGVNWVSGNRVDYTSTYTTTTRGTPRPTYSYTPSSSYGGGGLSSVEIILIVLGVGAIILAFSFCMRLRVSPSGSPSMTSLTAALKGSGAQSSDCSRVCSSRRSAERPYPHHIDRSIPSG